MYAHLKMSITKKMVIGLIFAALLCGIGVVIVVHAQDSSGFLNIDCGLDENSAYTDDTTTLKYYPDTGFIDTGVSVAIPRDNITEYDHEKPLWTVRSFPEGLRNCYNLSVVRGKGQKYLIRATFMYGNYDGRNQLPEFDLHLGVEVWDSVKFSGEFDAERKEIIHVPSSDYLYVCLVDKKSGTPFISALELRPIDNSMYKNTNSGSLAGYSRQDFGSTSNSPIRYPDDIFDRLWWPSNFPNFTQINTSYTIVKRTTNFFQPPPLVMSTALVPSITSQAIGFNWMPNDPTDQFYVYMHVAEVLQLSANQTRQFNIYLNNSMWFENVTTQYLIADTIFSTTGVSGEWLNYSFVKTPQSSLPPIINAIEVYKVIQFSQPQTYENDVYAIGNVKSIYGLKRNWQGDPCVPNDCLWEGLQCDYSGQVPRITYLNLSSSGLTGEIASYMLNLTMIQYLDLSNNSLTGPMPQFLSKLTHLKVLNLRGNNFSGPVPLELTESSRNGSLSLSVDGYEAEIPNPCQSVRCDHSKKNKVVVPATVSALGLFILLATMAVFWSLKHRKSRAGKEHADFDSSDASLTLKSQKYTYNEILGMTNNLKTVVGKGGFGTVYHGCVGNTQVAVKMLLPSSSQGYKEFQTEAELLTRVHHRNLTPLLGYCLEGTHMGLVYEYMANGNLRTHLSDRSEILLTWLKRLQIAIDAALGLEYLHKCCKPSVIHRDVKSTNILLNEKFQAKLADFGMSRVLPLEDDTHVSTKVAGTPGYLDPEYFVSCRLTEKSDVYSFGVVLLELITGQPAIVKSSEDKTHIIQWVNLRREVGGVKNVVDPSLQGDFESISVLVALEVALACVSPSAKRPAMNYVVSKLKESLAVELAQRNGHESDPEKPSGASPMSPDNEIYHPLTM